MEINTINLTMAIGEGLLSYAQAVDLLKAKSRWVTKIDSDAKYDALVSNAGCAALREQLITPD